MIKVNKDKCTGCRICEIICSIEHTDGINTKKARIRYSDNWPLIGSLSFCRQCQKKVCLEVCPTNAISLDHRGLITINNENCVECMACSDACIFGNLPVYYNKPLFCDTCNGKYLCINWCPRNALEKVSDN